MKNDKYINNPIRLAKLLEKYTIALNIAVNYHFEHDKRYLTWFSKAEKYQALIDKCMEYERLLEHKEYKQAS